VVEVAVQVKMEVLEDRVAVVAPPPIVVPTVVEMAHWGKEIMVDRVDMYLVHGKEQAVEVAPEQ
jgi:hypothetical protein